MYYFMTIIFIYICLVMFSCQLMFGEADFETQSQFDLDGGSKTTTMTKVPYEMLLLAATQHFEGRNEWENSECWLQEKL